MEISLLNAQKSKDFMNELLKAKEVAKAIKCSLPLIYKMADRGQLPCVRIPCIGKGKRKKTLVRFKKADVLAFIEANYIAST